MKEKKGKADSASSLRPTGDPMRGAHRHVSPDPTSTYRHGAEHRSGGSSGPFFVQQTTQVYDSDGNLVLVKESKPRAIPSEAFSPRSRVAVVVDSSDTQSPTGSPSRPAPVHRRTRSYDVDPAVLAKKIEDQLYPKRNNRTPMAKEPKEPKEGLRCLVTDNRHSSFSKVAHDDPSESNGEEEARREEERKVQRIP
jgi:hypothetical protein